MSVLIPTRDRWPLLEKTLTSALGQEDVALEVVVVDDGSRDETPSRLAAIGDPGVRVLRHEESRGVAAARNTGLAAARGEWLAPLDDDDLWAPRKLRTQLDAAAGTGASFAYCAALLIDEHGKAIRPQGPAPDPDHLPGALLAYNSMPGGASNVIARTDLVRRLGGFDERARFDDWDLYIRLAAAARGVRCDEMLVAYRRHPGNRILGDRHDLAADLEYLAGKHRGLSTEHRVEFDRLAFLRTLAWAHRRAGRRRDAARLYMRGAWQYRSPGNLARAGLSLFGDWGSGRREAREFTPPEWLQRVSPSSRTEPRET